MRSMDQEVELLVAGGGLAGFCAALAAAEAGHSVLLLEKTGATGGSSAMSGGCLAFAGTDVQRAAGVEDSAELLFRDLREVGKLQNDEALVRRYADEQLATYEWLRANGVVFGTAMEASSGQSVPRVHNVDPADMVRALEARAKASGKVEVRLGAGVRRLVRDADSGRVTGVALEDGTTIASRRGVILACGGFSRDPELVARFAPGSDQAVFLGGDGNVGDGLRMAWALGADVRDMAHIKATYGKHPIDATNNHSCLAVYKGAIAVNQDGRRYVDESISYKLLGDACLRQPYATTYQILDQDVMDSGDDAVRILDFKRRLEEGLFFQADSLDQLARLVEIDPAALCRTVADYNGYVDAGHDPDFDRKALVHNHGKLRRIERAPFYAYPSGAAVYGTYCGLRVDRDLRVIDVFGEPIDGLFAAGEVIGGFHGAAYMTGSALGKAAVFGRAAARSALA